MPTLATSLPLPQPMRADASAAARHPQAAAAALPAGAAATAARAAAATRHAQAGQPVVAPIPARSPARLPQPSRALVHAHTRYTQPATLASRARAAADTDCSPAASLPDPRPQPTPATASNPHAPTYVITSDHTIGGEPAPILAREVGTGQAPCAVVVGRCSGLEPGEPQLSPVSQVRRHCVVSAVARGQAGGRRSAAREGAREREGTGLEAASEREGTGLEPASHRCFDRQAVTYSSIGSTELLLSAQHTPYIYSGGSLPVQHRAAVAMQHLPGGGGCCMAPPRGGLARRHAPERGRARPACSRFTWGALRAKPEYRQATLGNARHNRTPLPRAKGASSDARRPLTSHARARTHAHSMQSPRTRTPSAAEGRVS